jgi:archaellum component FlaC
VGTDDEEMLHNYLERSKDLGRNFGAFPDHGVYKELQELRERVARLETEKAPARTTKE